jgi:TrmH family RNA methyltransferase
MLAAAADTSVAVVFGTESAGLSNVQLDLCHKLLYIPANPEYSSLNLASAVQLVAYELHYAQTTLRAEKSSAHPPATSEQMEYFYEHLRDVLIASGFLEADNPRQMMRRLRLIFNRAGLDQNELNIMRGVLSALDPDASSKQRKIS